MRLEMGDNAKTTLVHLSAEPEPPVDRNRRHQPSLSERVTFVLQARLYRLGEGPFAGDAGRIKQARLIPRG
jgi:hypothetical protein